MVQLSPHLAAVVERLCERWGLTLSDEAPKGEWNTILAVSRRDVPCVLKIAGPEHNAIDEAIALEAWNGNGAARLLEADRDHGALLLERLDPDCTLGSTSLVAWRATLPPIRATSWCTVICTTTTSWPGRGGRGWPLIPSQSSATLNGQLPN